MKLPQEPSSDQPIASQNAGERSAEEAFEQELAEVERSLQELKDRYQQVKTDQQVQEQVQQRFEQVQQALQSAPDRELQVELKRIKTQLEALEVNLESRLISWSSLREIFWQTVRFGGLGVVIGWLFAFYVIKNPTPTSTPHSTPTPLTPQP